MEHRYSQRIKTHSQVMIYERGLPISTGIAINSSRYGFFIETNHAVVRNQPLEIELIDRARRARVGSAGGRRIKCFVVHAQVKGFGVEIDEAHINEFSAIAAMRNLVEEPAYESVSAMKATSVR